MGIYFTPKQDTIMKKLCFILLLYAFCLLPLAAQHPPKHEVRAAWITAVYGLDWPRTRATTPEGIRKQQAELVEILDKLKAANFNTVLFQTRTRGDVLYQSAIEPYNSILTGKVGGNPGYDPLAFAIAESSTLAVFSVSVAAAVSVPAALLSCLPPQPAPIVPRVRQNARSNACSLFFI